VIRIQWKTSLFKQIQHGREILLPLASIPNMKLPLRTMVLRFRRSVLLINALRKISMESLQALIPIMDLIPAIRIIFYNARPLFIIISRTNTINTKVDSTRTTKSLTARVIQLTIVSKLLGRRLVAPVHVLV
jgi:hypothetical protein